VPYVFTDPDSDRIGLVHYQPHLLTQAQRDQGHEVDAAAVQPPAVDHDEQAVAYWRDGSLVWEIEPAPLDPQAAELRRLAAGVEPWAAPTGAHDAPNTGDHRWHDGIVWRSLIDGNTTEPGSDPRWWEPSDPPAVPDKLRSPLLELRPNVGPDVQALIDVLTGS